MSKSKLSRRKWLAGVGSATGLAALTPLATKSAAAAKPSQANRLQDERFRRQFFTQLAIKRAEYYRKMGINIPFRTGL